MVREPIGVIVPNLGVNQLAFLVINYLNTLANMGDDCVVFYEDLALPCIQPQFATMNISEIWSFNGRLISTTIDNTLLSIKSIGSPNKIFYVWDLEWLRGKQNFVTNVGIYRNQEIELYARSLDHANEIHNYSGRLPKVVENFNISKLI